MFNTQTNVISSIPDFNIILKVFSDYSEGKSLDEIKDNMVAGNVYGIRTKGSRVRFYTAINSTFLQFKSAEHKELIKSIYTSDLTHETKKYIGYIQMGINNELFYLLTTKVLSDLLMQGRLTLDKQVFISFIMNLRNDNTEIIKWTDETIGTIAYKYLTLMKKLGFLKGAKKKEFTSFNPTDEMIILTIYLIDSLEMECSSFLKNPYSSLLLMTNKGIMERLRRLSLQNYLSISTTGQDMQIELKCNYKDIVGEIRKNY